MKGRQESQPAVWGWRGGMVGSGRDSFQPHSAPGYQLGSTSTLRQCQRTAKDGRDKIVTV